MAAPNKTTRNLEYMFEVGGSLTVDLGLSNLVVLGSNLCSTSMGVEEEGSG